MTALALVTGLAFAASVAPAIAQSDAACMDDIAKEVPYLAESLKYADIPSTDFTLFMPTEAAAKGLAMHLAAEGCNRLPVDTISSIMDAGIVPGKFASDDYATPTLYTFRTGEGPMTLRVSKPDNFLVVETMDDAVPGAVADVALGAPAGLDTPVCGGRGILHLVDDVIMPPSLSQEVADASEIAAAGECPLAAAAAATAAEPAPEDEDYTTDYSDYQPLEDTLLTGVNITLESPSVSARNQVQAQLFATATDADGSRIDIDETIILAVDAELTEVEGGGASGPPTNVQVAVPVSVGVFVEPTEECEVASISVPVSVAVDIELMVAGTMLGKGRTDMKYAPCRGAPGGKWDACGGRSVSDRGEPSAYRYGCEKGLQCVRKNEWYAACMTPAAAKVFRDERGWDGMILKCRRQGGGAAPAVVGSPGGYGE